MVSSKKKSISSIVCICIVSLCPLTALSYPVIPELISRNFLFSQYQEEVLAAEKAMKSGTEPYIDFFMYTGHKGDKFHEIAARCSIPQETLATVNHLDDSQMDLEGITLILPTVKGLYIPLQPTNHIEILLAKEHATGIRAGAYPVVYINGEKFYFLKNTYFSSTVRAFFLHPDMGLPLENYVLTSSFGMRISPISGKWLFHQGIDMAAPLGTKILACKRGRVKEIVKMDRVYGNYVILEHDGGMTSRYAHLSSFSNIQVGDIVPKGQVLGYVGQTGMATGPHLHFEIKLNGKSEDPQKYLKK